MSKKRWVLSLLGAAILAALALVGILFTAGGDRAAQAGVLAQETSAPVPVAQAKAWLGVAIAQLNQRLAERLGLGQQEGVVIVRVLPNSPAAQAGLLAKDIITAIDGTAVTTVREVQEAIKAKNPGDPAPLAIVRDDTSRDVPVTLGSRPEPQPKPHFPRGLGFLPGLPELEGVATEQLFDHLLGFDLRLTDKEGHPLTLHVTSGAITSVGDNSLTIDPNGPATSATYSVTTDTVVAVPGRRLGALNSGDKVMVVTVGDSAEARAVLAPHGIRGRAFGLRGHWQIPDGRGEGHQGALPFRLSPGKMRIRSQGGNAPPTSRRISGVGQLPPALWSPVPPTF